MFIKTVLRVIPKTISISFWHQIYINFITEEIHKLYINLLDKSNYKTYFT